jgi:hypothetical protein
VGSAYTLQMLKEMFAIPNDKTELFYENGISKDFLSRAKMQVMAAKSSCFLWED